MSHETINIIYAILAMLTALVLTFRTKTKHKVITFLVSFWILGESVVSLDMFTLNLPSIGGDIQLKRAVILSMTGYLFVISLMRFKKSEKVESMPYEKYFFAFVSWFLIIIVYHLFDGMVNTKRFIVLLQATLSLIIPYIVIKKHGDDDMILVFFKTFIIISVVTSIVAIIQFFIDPQFMRVGTTLMAFGGRLRSQGIFWSEYQHAYILAFAIALVLLTVKSVRLKVSLISLFLVGIVLAFHRMSWIATFIIFAVYIVAVKGVKVWKLIVVGLVFLFTVYVLSSEVFHLTEDITQSEVYQSRLSSNTMTNRFKFYEMVFDNLNKIYFWGAGSTSNSIYYHGMLSTGVVDEKWAKGEVGGIHNLFLEIVFFYGIPSLILFIIMLSSMIRTYFKLFINEHRIFLFSFLFLIVYVIMNLTNAFSLTGDFTFILSLMLGSSAAIHLRQIHKSEESTIYNITRDQDEYFN